MKRAMTRRDFLHRFGMVGGSTAMFGAMDAWSMLGQPAGPRPQWDGDANARVLVLGAGLSGMSVAWELGKLGYEVQVLEARDRVGGVNFTVRRGTTVTEFSGATQVCDFADGMYLNGGPWRIPNSHAAVLGYCKELGVPLQVFINENDSVLLYYEGEEAGDLAGRAVRLREVKADLRGYTSELLSKAINQRQLDLPVTQEDTEMLVRYLAWEGYLGEDNGAYLGSVARGDGDPYDPFALLNGGFWRRVRAIDNVGNMRAPMFQPIGGMDQIPMAFGRALGGKITRGAEVQSITQTADDVRVVYLDRTTDTRHELTADYVVSCLPISILQQLEVNLSPEMKDTVSQVHYSDSAKIGMQMKRRFWEEDYGIYGGITYTDLPLGSFGYPSNDFFSDRGVLLGFYGSDGLGDLREKTVEGRLEHVLENASKFHPEMRDNFETGFSVLWSKTPYSNGAYAHDTTSILDKLRQPDGRIYLGCAAVSEQPGWMEGAFSAAWGTVDRLHRRVMA